MGRRECTEQRRADRNWVQYGQETVLSSVMVSGRHEGAFCVHCVWTDTSGTSKIKMVFKQAADRIQCHLRKDSRHLFVLHD